MTNKFTSTIDVYNKHASQFVKHFEKKLDVTEADKFLSMVTAGGKVLDAGCGSARDAAYFVRKGYQALGIDLSAGLLAEAKKIHPEVPTKLMSLINITLEDSSYDGVWSKAAILHIPRSDVPTVLKHFHRILKPGGALFIQTKAGEGESTQPVPFDNSLERLFTFFTARELEALVSAAGFTVLNSYDFNGTERFQGSRDQDWVVIFARK